LASRTISPSRSREGILEHHHDLEAVRAMLGHTRIDTTHAYARIRSAELKRAMEFYEEKAVGVPDA
jgi:site-specific recombinase XerC